MLKTEELKDRVFMSRTRLKKAAIDGETLAEKRGHALFFDEADAYRFAIGYHQGRLDLVKRPDLITMHRAAIEAIRLRIENDRIAKERDDLAAMLESRPVPVIDNRRGGFWNRILGR